jgi:hypothetical protein
LKTKNLAGGPTLAAAPIPAIGVCARAIVVTSLGLVLTACATATPGRQGQLSSYEGVTKTSTLRTKAYLRADRTMLRNAHTFQLEPVRFADGVGGSITSAQREVVANAASRAICAALSERLAAPAPGVAPDLLVRATITGFIPTGRTMAGASFVISHLSPVPFTPRIPFGLGSFSAEGEAVDGAGHQLAALVWERGADAFTSSPKVSVIGDAYQLSVIFGHDMGELVVTGDNPIHNVSLPNLPHHRKPAASCAVFGKGPGLTGFVAGRFAAAPEWLDRPDKAQPPEDHSTPPSDPTQ